MSTLLFLSLYAAAIAFGAVALAKLEPEPEIWWIHEYSGYQELLRKRWLWVRGPEMVQ